MKTMFHMIMFKAFHAQRNHIRSFLKDIGLSSGQPKVLNYIDTHDSCMQKDVAMHCDIEAATVSKLLSTMEENELIMRRTVEGNRRAGCISITQKGKTALEKWRIHCKEVEKLSLTGFSTEEQEQFVSYLCRMYHNLSGKEIE